MISLDQLSGEELDNLVKSIQELWGSDELGMQYLQSRGITVDPHYTHMQQSRIGDIIEVNGVKGYVIATYDSGRPKWLVSDKPFGLEISWMSALNISLPPGWIIPTREEAIEGEFRGGLEKLLDEIPSFMQTSSGDREFYVWLRSEYSGDTNYAWMINLEGTSLEILDKTSDSYTKVYAFYKFDK